MKEIAIDLDKVLLVCWHLILRKDRQNGTLADTRSTVDAVIGIDVILIGLWCGVNTVAGTDCDT